MVSLTCLLEISSETKSNPDPIVENSSMPWWKKGIWCHSLSYWIFFLRQCFPNWVEAKDFSLMVCIFSTHLCSSQWSKTQIIYWKFLVKRILQKDFFHVDFSLCDNHPANRPKINTLWTITYPKNKIKVNRFFSLQVPFRKNDSPKTLILTLRTIGLFSAFKFFAEVFFFK